MDKERNGLFLVDANIIIEMLLGQERAKECASFFDFWDFDATDLKRIEPSEALAMIDHETG